MRTPQKNQSPAYFSTTFLKYKVEELDGMLAYYDKNEQLICVSPEGLKNKHTVPHEMIHVYEDLINEQHPSAPMIELTGEIGNATSLEVEVVHVDVKTLFVVHIKLFLGILQEECGLSDASRTLDANHTVVPVNLIHECTTNRSIHMLNQITMRAEKSLHLLQFVFLSGAKIQINWQIAKRK